jgi:hypothetical protein
LADLQQAYEFLLAALRKNGLDWVVLQVQEEVRSGRTVTKEVAPLEESPTPDFLDGKPRGNRGRKGKRQRLEATEDYSSRERVQLALSALEAAVVQTSELEEYLLSHLGNQSEQITIRFEPDELDEAHAFSLASRSPQRTAAINDLRALVAKLRNEINNSGD